MHVGGSEAPFFQSEYSNTRCGQLIGTGLCRVVRLVFLHGTIHLGRPETSSRPKQPHRPVRGSKEDPRLWGDLDRFELNSFRSTLCMLGCGWMKVWLGLKTECVAFMIFGPIGAFLCLQTHLTNERRGRSHMTECFLVPIEILGVKRNQTSWPAHPLIQIRANRPLLLPCESLCHYVGHARSHHIMFRTKPV